MCPARCCIVGARNVNSDRPAVRVWKRAARLAVRVWKRPIQAPPGARVGCGESAGCAQRHPHNHHDPYPRAITRPCPGNMHSTANYESAPDAAPAEGEYYPERCQLARSEPPARVVDDGALPWGEVSWGGGARSGPLLLTRPRAQCLGADPGTTSQQNAAGRTLVPEGAPPPPARSEDQDNGLQFFVSVAAAPSCRRIWQRLAHFCRMPSFNSDARRTLGRLRRQGDTRSAAALLKRLALRVRNLNAAIRRTSIR